MDWDWITTCFVMFKTVMPALAITKRSVSEKKFFQFCWLPEEVVEQVIFFLIPTQARSACLYTSARISIVQQHKAQLLVQLQQIQALGKVCGAFKRCLLKLPFEVRVMFRLEIPVVDAIVFKFDIHEEILHSLFGWTKKTFVTLRATSAPKSEFVGQALAYAVYEEDRKVFLDLVDIPVPAFSNFRSLPSYDVSSSPAKYVCLHVSLKPGKLLYFVTEATNWSEWHVQRAFARSAQYDLCSLNKFIAEGHIYNDHNPNWFFLILVPVEYILKMKAAKYIVTEDERFGGSYKCCLTGLSDFPDIEPFECFENLSLC
jgi:hypothetical protein